MFLFIIRILHVGDVSAQTVFVEEVETLGLHELILLLDVVQTNDAPDHGNIPHSEELSAHLYQLEHDRTAQVLLALAVHLS